MSYSFYLKKEVTEMKEVFWKNYTSNVAKMWHKALGFDFIKLDGKSGLYCVVPLTKAIEHMENNKDEYVEMNPENGWGNYVGALQTLIEIKTACLKHPTATLTISR